MGMLTKERSGSLEVVKSIHRVPMPVRNGAVLLQARIINSEQMSNVPSECKIP